MDEVDFLNTVQTEESPVCYVVVSEVQQCLQELGEQQQTGVWGRMILAQVLSEGGVISVGRNAVFN